MHQLVISLSAANTKLKNLVRGTRNVLQPPFYLLFSFSIIVQKEILCFFTNERQVLVDGGHLS